MFSYLANPKRYQPVGRIIKWCGMVLALFGLSIGLYLSFFGSPADIYHGETVRILYIHVPAAWLSLLIYASIGLAGLSMIIWRHLLAGLYIWAAAPVGAVMTGICLVTGALWGQPGWGTWWVWDARLTSVLVLFFLYCGLILLRYSIDNRMKALDLCAWLAVIGVVNLPIIKYSVEWWSTLHQPASISSLARIKDPALDSAMMWPLLAMTIGLIGYCMFVIAMRLDHLIHKSGAGDPS